MQILILLFQRGLCINCCINQDNRITLSLMHYCNFSHEKWTRPRWLTHWVCIFNVTSLAQISQECSRIFYFESSEASLYVSCVVLPALLTCCVEGDAGSIKSRLDAILTKELLRGFRRRLRWNLTHRLEWAWSYVAVASVVKGGVQPGQVTVYRETKYCVSIMLFMLSALKYKLL